METTTFSAASNPDLANDLISQIVEEKPEVVEASIELANENVVTLPGGYLTLDGEVHTYAEVRELTGKDEEAISKMSNIGRALMLILSRGVVSVGDQKATEKVLDELLSGDRDALLLGIYKATFGDTAELPAYCDGCDDVKTVEINVNDDIKTRKLDDPFTRSFTVEGKSNEYTVVLPTGVTQKELFLSTDKTVAEMTTILLQNTVTSIDGRPVFGRAQIQNLGIADRRAIGDKIGEINPGPQMDDLTVECPDCGSEVKVSINFGSLFRF
jgi:hypothetical protein